RCRDFRISRPQLLRHGPHAGGAGAVLPLRAAGDDRRDGATRCRPGAGAGLSQGENGVSEVARTSVPRQAHPPPAMRLAARRLDGVTLLVVPAVAFVLLLFVYPFLYGLWLSFQPKEGGWLANYAKFFADPFLYETIAKTLWIAVPATLFNVLISIPVAMRMRLMHRQRLLTTILILPITLGT